MPDITLCTNKDCPIKSECYRAVAKPNQQQSYTTFEPTYTKVGKKVKINCQFFMFVKPKHKA